MPAFTLDIEDYSPFITYSGSDWSPGTSVGDQSLIQYSRSTFMKTSKAGDIASISFNGTGLVIYGAKRANHGLYFVNVDGQNQPAVNGSATPDQFGVALYEKHDFAQGPHTVQLINQENFYLDLDWVTVEANIGENSNGNLRVVNYEDSDTSFTYLPSASQWSTNPLHLGMYSASSGHVTTTTGSSFDFSFNVSDGVSLYGPMSQSGAPYSVSLDGETQSFNSSSDRYQPQALLFHATNLGAGQHQLKVSYQPTGNLQTFAVDNANVYTTNQASNSTSVSPNGSSSSSNPTGGSGSTTGGSGLSAGAAAGITVAACIVAALLGVLIALLMRKKRKQRVEEMKQTSNTVNPYTGADGFQTANLVSPAVHNRSLPAAAMVDGYGGAAAGSGSGRHRAAPSDSNASSPNLVGGNTAATSSDGGFSDMYAVGPSPLLQKSRLASPGVQRDQGPGISPPEYTPNPSERL